MVLRVKVLTAIHTAGLLTLPAEGIQLFPSTGFVMASLITQMVLQSAN